MAMQAYAGPRAAAHGSCPRQREPLFAGRRSAGVDDPRAVDCRLEKGASTRSARLIDASYFGRFLHGAVLLPYTPSSDSGNRPQWAKSIKTRRGVDPPFIAPKKTSSLDKLCSYSGWSSSTARAPQSLPQVHTREHGSQYVEIEMRSSPVLPEIITPLQGQPLSYGLFPDCVVDPDAPIRKYSVSRLVTADNSWCSERRLPPRMPPRTPPRTSI
ncbi:hypothetical protein B0H21DRAFT_896276 [Amylocystis lapponica]|nr:hypothetical protein B0H21DRAFT_896276 [Amylocystis lapponica]